MILHEPPGNICTTLESAPSILDICCAMLCNTLCGCLSYKWYGRYQISMPSLQLGSLASPAFAPPWYHIDDVRWIYLFSFITTGWILWKISWLCVPSCTVQYYYVCLLLRFFCHCIHDLGRHGLNVIQRILNHTWIFSRDIIPFWFGTRPREDHRPGLLGRIVQPQGENAGWGSNKQG